MMQSLVSVLDQAYRWLCQQRRDYPPDADVWDVRFHWHAERIRLEAELRCGRFRFGPLSVITKADGEVLHLWSARDALVLKALALIVGPLLRLSPRCVHVKGHGGLKAAVREVQQRLPDYSHVLRTDVKGFYESIDQSILLAQLAALIDDSLVLALLGQAIQRTVERGGLYWDIRTGISRGCPLSPLLGALYLKVLDERLSGTEPYYVRYMDDILVLTKTRWQLRRAVRTLNQTFDELKVSQHPDKTFIGRIERGFDFLGYYFCHGPLRLAQRTLQNHATRLHRLYEQQKTAPAGAVRLDEYVTRWKRWCRAGLGRLDRSGLQSPGALAREAKTRETDAEERERGRFGYDGGGDPAYRYR
jgi:RNA-directed DNA polymerase